MQKKALKFGFRLIFVLSEILPVDGLVNSHGSFSCIYLNNEKLTQNQIEIKTKW